MNFRALEHWYPTDFSEHPDEDLDIKLDHFMNVFVQFAESRSNMLSAVTPGLFALYGNRWFFQINLHFFLVSFHIHNALTWSELTPNFHCKRQQSSTPCTAEHLASLLVNHAISMHRLYFQAPSLPVHVNPVDKIAPNRKWNQRNIRQI